MNNAHVEEFFRHLTREYERWQNERKVKEPNIQFFELANQLNGTIFSYSGWADTSSARKTDEKDAAIASMLERSLDMPSIIVDVGTYDGTRLKNILDRLHPKAYNNIVRIKGIDINAEALSKAEQTFNGYDKPFEKHHDRIEHTDISKFGKERKITLYLGNMLFNIRDEATIIPFLSRKSRKDDISIIEAHRKINNSSYPENVERFFVEYFRESGIQSILKGRLAAVFAEDGKRVFIEDIPGIVKYKHQTYRFESIFLDSLGYKGVVQPVICIGVSRVLQNSWNFMWKMAYNGFEAPFKEDVQLIRDDILLRLHHAHDSRFFTNLVRRRDDALNAYGGDRLDYILRFGEYPKHYDTHPLIGYHPDQVEIVEGNRRQ